MPSYFDRVLEGYVECALWSSMDESDDNGGDPMDAHYEGGDIAADSMKVMSDELRDFLALLDREEIDTSSLNPEQIGHDFWLTRNRHGAGFWDRGLGKLGDELTKWAHSYGEAHLYVGDDGAIHYFNG